jgi:uroporphyrinogen-III synthase
MNKPVLLIRASGNEKDAAALAALGINSLIDPYLQISHAEDANGARNLVSVLESSPGPLWLIATSVNAIRIWAELIGEDLLQKSISSRGDLNFAAIGEKTANILRQYGAKGILVPHASNSLALANLLISEHLPGHALIPGGNLAMQNLPHSLSNSGWRVSTAVVYVTKRVALEPKSAQLLRNQEISAVLLRSPSAVRALTHFVPSPEIPLVCAGGTTAQAVEAQGLTVAAISAGPAPSEIAATIQTLLER